MTDLQEPVRKRDSHLWARDEHDWYVEPEWCSQRLFEVEQFGKERTIFDPACGMGRILVSAMNAGYTVCGSDVVDRGHPNTVVKDFMVVSGLSRFKPVNIVSNPPFGMARQFAEKALDCAFKVALLLPAKWISGDERSRWLATTPLERVYFLTPRPSMPPGRVIEAGIAPGGGREDFAWFIWRYGYKGNPAIGWIRKNGEPV